MPANFRTYEGQSRLLTAVIAAHPGLKLNYKDIAIHYGSDWTESGIEHFFRPLKKNAKAIQDMVKRNEDPANFNHQVYFGESTPDGIQFQFRQIKKDAENMRQGKEAAPSSSSVTSTPVKTPKTPKTPGGRTTKRPAPASTSKSTATKKVKREAASDAETFAALNADDLEMLAGAGNNAAATAPAQDQTPTRARTQPFEPPALDLTQATSPEDNDDTLTPHEDPTYSFAHANAAPPSLGADPFAPYHGSLHGGGGGQAYFASFSKDEYEDDGEV